MASAYSTVRTYSDYIVPVNLELAGQILAYKQQKYDENQRLLQSRADYVSNIDLMKPADKEYLSNRLKDITATLNNIGAVDLSNASVFNTIDRAISSAIDKNVMIGIQGTQLARKEAAEKAELFKDKPELWHPDNERDSLERLDEWISSPVGTPYKGSRYQPYVDIEKEIFKEIKDNKDWITKKYDYTDKPSDPNNPVAGFYFINRKGEKVSEEEVADLANSVLDRYAPQVAINAKYRVSSSYDAAKHIERLNKANEAREKGLSELESLVSLEVDDVKKQQLQTQMTQLGKAIQSTSQEILDIQGVLNTGNAKDIQEINEKSRLSYYRGNILSQTIDRYAGIKDETVGFKDDRIATTLYKIQLDNQTRLDIAQLRAQTDLMGKTLTAVGKSTTSGATSGQADGKTGRTNKYGQPLSKEDSAKLEAQEQALETILSTPMKEELSSGDLSTVYNRAASADDVFFQALRDELKADRANRSMDDAKFKTKWGGTKNNSDDELIASGMTMVGKGSAYFNPATTSKLRHANIVQKRMNDFNQVGLDQIINKEDEFVKSKLDINYGDPYLLVGVQDGKWGLYNSTKKESVKLRDGNGNEKVLSPDTLKRITYNFNILAGNLYSGEENNITKNLALMRMNTLVTGANVSIINPWDTPEENIERLTAYYAQDKHGDVGKAMIAFMKNPPHSIRRWSDRLVSTAKTAGGLAVDVKVPFNLKETMTKAFTEVYARSSGDVTHNIMTIIPDDFSKGYPQLVSILRTAIEAESSKQRVKSGWTSSTATHIQLDPADPNKLQIKWVKPASNDDPAEAKEMTTTIPIAKFDEQFIKDTNIDSPYRAIYDAALYPQNSSPIYQGFIYDPTPQKGVSLAKGGFTLTKDTLKEMVDEGAASLGIKEPAQIDSYKAAVDKLLNSYLTMQLQPTREGGWNIDYVITGIKNPNKSIYRMANPSRYLNATYPRHIERGNDSFMDLLLEAIDYQSNGRSRAEGLMSILQNFLSL